MTAMSRDGKPDDGVVGGVDLSKYNMSFEYGFMLEDPLTELPPYFEKWNHLAKSLPRLLEQKQVRAAVDELPLLDHAHLAAHRELRLAHLQLSFITSQYVWQDGDGGVPQKLPKNLAVPYHGISQRLGIKPILGHVDLLANWVLVDTDGAIDLDNLDCLYPLPGSIGGKWFCVVTYMVEFSFNKCLKPVVEIVDLLMRTHQNSTKEIDFAATTEKMCRCLRDIRHVIDVMRQALGRMHDNLTAATFFNLLRPYLGGWGGEGNALPQGLVYEGVSDAPVELPGGSAAQSSTLQVIDALLGVQHQDDKREFLTSMRDFMPTGHRKFIEDLETIPFTLRQLLTLTHGAAPPELKTDFQSAYNSCVSALVEFRSYHIQIVTKYIVVAARESNEGNYESLDAMGTGGTSLIPFLRVLRADTEQQLMGTEQEVVDTEQQIMGTEQEVVDTEQQLMDFDQDVVDRERQLMDLELEQDLVDTEQQLMDLKQEVVDTERQLMETGHQLVDTNRQQRNTDGCVDDRLTTGGTPPPPARVPGFYQRCVDGAGVAAVVVAVAVAAGLIYRRFKLS